MIKQKAKASSFIGVAGFIMLFIGISTASAASTSTLYGGSVAGAGGDGSAISASSQFNLPQDFAVASNGDQYIADTANHCIRKVSASGSILSTIAGLCGTPGYIEGIGTSARFNNPTAIALSNDGGMLYVADTGNNVIRKIELSTFDSYLGNPVTVYQTFLVAGDSTTPGLAEGIGSAAKFNQPKGIDVSYDGRFLYVSDTGNSVIRSITLDTLATYRVVGSTAGYQEGIGTSALFRNPTELVLDKVTSGGVTSNMNIYVSDSGNNTIRKIPLATLSTSVVVGAPSTTGAYAEGTGVGAKFNNPRGLAIDNAGGFMYASDSGNNRIRKIDFSTNTTSLLIGSGTAGYLEGSDSTVQMSGPTGLFADFQKNYLYYVDTNNNKIRRTTINSYNTLVNPNFYLESQDTMNVSSAPGLMIDVPYLKFKVTFGEKNANPHNVTFTYEVAETGTTFGSPGSFQYSTTMPTTTTYPTNETFSLFVGEPFLAHGKSYHVRWKLTDASGSTTDWNSFGGNSESAADFTVNPVKKDNLVSTVFTSPTGESYTGTSVVKDSTRNIMYVGVNSCIKKINLNTLAVSVIAGNCNTRTTADAYAGGSILGSSASLGLIQGMALDETNNLLYFTEQAGYASGTGFVNMYYGRVRKIDLNTNSVSFIAGGSGGSHNCDAPNGIQTNLENPTGLVFDGENNYLYVGETYLTKPNSTNYNLLNDAICKIDLSSSNSSTTLKSWISIDRSTWSTSMPNTATGTAWMPNLTFTPSVLNANYSTFTKTMMIPSVQLAYSKETHDIFVSQADMFGVNDSNNAGKLHFNQKATILKFNLDQNLETILSQKDWGLNNKDWSQVNSYSSNQYQIYNFETYCTNGTLVTYPTYICTTYSPLYTDNTGSTTSAYHHPAGLTYDSGTNMLYVADAGNSRIRKIDVSTGNSYYVAGGYDSPFVPFMEGAGSNARFNMPYGLFIDTTEHNLYVSDTGGKNIRKLYIGKKKTPELTFSLVDPSGFTTISPNSNTNIISPTIRINYTLKDMDYDDRLKFEVAVYESGSSFDSNGITNSTQYTFAGVQYSGTMDIGEPILNYNKSYFIKYRLTDSDGNTYGSGWMDYGNKSLPDFKVGSPQNTLTSSISNLSNISSQFTHAVRTSSGELYIVDNKKNCIYKEDKLGNISVIAGVCGTAGYVDGPALQAKFTTLNNIAVDEKNNTIYTMEYVNSSPYYYGIRKIDLNTGLVSSIAGNSNSAYSEGTGTGAGIQGSLYGSPMLVDNSTSTPFLYFSDTNHSRIRKINLITLQTSLVAGNGSCSAASDGIATNISTCSPGWSYNSPLPIAMDHEKQMLYVGSYVSPTATIYRIDLKSNYANIIYSTGSMTGFPTSMEYDSTKNTLYYTSSDQQIYALLPDFGKSVKIAGGTTGYAEGVGSSALFRDYNTNTSPYYNSYTSFDQLNNYLYVADGGNGKIRKINLNNYGMPSLANIKLREVDDKTNTDLVAGSTTRNKGIKIVYMLSSTDFIDSIKVQLEMKPSSQDFNGSDLIDIPSTLVMGSLNTNYFVNPNNLQLGESYHIRMRAINSGGTGSWIYYCSGTSGCQTGPYNADFKMPYSDGENFRTKYISGNGSSIFSSFGKSKMSVQNYTLSGAKAIDTDNDGNIFFISNSKIFRINKADDSVTYVTSSANITSLALDKMNDILYYSDSYNIYKVSKPGDSDQSPPIQIAGTSTSGDVLATGLTSQFNNISSISVSPTGNLLYVTDKSNNKIKSVILTDMQYPVTQIIGYPNTAGTGANIEGIGSNSSIGSPLSSDVSQDGQYLYVGNTNNIFKIDLSSSQNTLLTTMTGSNNYIKADDSGKYLFISNGFQKISTDSTIPGGAKLSNTGTYLEGITYIENGTPEGKYGNGSSGSIDGLAYVGENLYFIDSGIRLRSIKIPNAGISHAVPNAPSAASQYESDGTTPITTTATTKSQTIYLKSMIGHQNKLTHVQAEVELKPLGVSFDGNGTVLGNYKFYINTDTQVTNLLTMDNINPGVQYHWRVRTRDIFGNVSPWTIAATDANGKSFETGPVAIGQTNLVMGLINSTDTTGIYPMVNLPSIPQGSYVEKNIDGSINGVYFIDKTSTPGCLKYFDYRNYKGKSLSSFIKTMKCDSSFNNAKYTLKKRKVGTITELYYFNTTQIFKASLTATGTNITNFAGSTASGSYDASPINSTFTNIVDIEPIHGYNVGSATDIKRCMLITDNQGTNNLKIRITSLDGAGFWCYGIGSNSNDGNTQMWIGTGSIQNTSCLKADVTDDTVNSDQTTGNESIIYVNGGAISKLSGSYTTKPGLPCLNSSLDTTKQFMYFFDTDNKLYKTSLANPLTDKVWITGFSGSNSYFESDQVNAKFTAGQNLNSLILFDIDKLFLFDNNMASLSSKMRTVALNTYAGPVISSISPTSGNTNTQVTITGLNFGTIADLSTTASIYTHVTLGGVMIPSSNIISWSNTQIVVKIPDQTLSGDIRVTTNFGTSGPSYFLVTNPPQVTTVYPANGSKPNEIVHLYGLYFNGYNASSKVFFSSSGSLIPGAIVLGGGGWTSNQIDVYMPNGSVTGTGYVATQYGTGTFQYTVINGNPPQIPNITYPISDGQIITTATPIVTISSGTTFDGASHKSTYWQIKKPGNSFFEDLSTGWDSTNLTSFQIPPGTLIGGQTYTIQVSIKDSNGLISSYAKRNFVTVTQFVGNTSPITPTAITPSGPGYTYTGTLTFQGSEYQDGDSSGTTAMSRSEWNLFRCNGNDCTAQMIPTITSTETSITYSAPSLGIQPGGQYAWQLRHCDSGYQNDHTSLCSAWSNKQYFSASAIPNNTTTTGQGGVYYDAPSDVQKITTSTNSGQYTVNLLSSTYSDSMTDQYSDINDKLDTVQWQVLWFTGSTNLNLSTNSSGFVVDSRISGVKFSNAKIYKTSRNDCTNSESWAGSPTCLLNQTINYSELGKVGTYLVRARHIDQFGMISPNWSDAGYFQIDKMPVSSGQYSGILRSVATLNVNIIASDQSNLDFKWSTTTSGLTMTGITDPNCGTIPAQYQIYDGCIYKSGDPGIYGYVMGFSGSGSSTLKFEPVRLSPDLVNRTYGFKVVASRKGKSQTGNFKVDVSN